MPPTPTSSGSTRTLTPCAACAVLGMSSAMAIKIIAHRYPAPKCVPGWLFGDILMASPILLDMASRHIFEGLFHLKIIVTFFESTQNIVHMALLRGLGFGVGVLLLLCVGFVGGVVLGRLLIAFVGRFVLIAVFAGVVGILVFIGILAVILFIILLLLLLLLIVLRRSLRVELAQVIEGRGSLGAQQKLGLLGVVIMHDLVRKQRDFWGVRAQRAQCLGRLGGAACRDDLVARKA